MDSQSVILGDFNIFDISKYAHLFETEYTSSSEFTSYISFPAEQATFDYVLLPRSLALESLSSTEGLSDHNALTIKITTIEH